eukprot:1895857-Alexandrium_andersonii.AAC.1
MLGGRTAGLRWSGGLRSRRGRKETLGAASLWCHGSSWELPAMAPVRSRLWGGDAGSCPGDGLRRPARQFACCSLRFPDDSAAWP